MTPSVYITRGSDYKDPLIEELRTPRESTLIKEPRICDKGTLIKELHIYDEGDSIKELHIYGESIPINEPLIVLIKSCQKASHSQQRLFDQETSHSLQKYLSSLDEWTCLITIQNSSFQP
ncbi:hypothetical protein Fot_14687 [Forsythia ovata]|uniref:Uncharacterized protein n=1 Tax=Forsythia ovata TaxID=205694 RepID=A0ABD1W713_9LAMI